MIYSMLLGDPSLPHQIVLRQVSNEVGVSCNCLARVQVTSRRLSPGLSCFERQFIEVRSRWELGEAARAYRAWHDERGIGLPAVTWREER
jgi:hypothetical protein